MYISGRGEELMKALLIEDPSPGPVREKQTHEF
jgi:hypothetical protein